MKTQKLLLAAALALLVMLALIATGAHAATTTGPVSNQTFTGHNSVSFIATQTPCVTAPDRPALLLPKNASSLIQTKVTLSWNTTRCAEWYQVTVHENSTTGKLILNQLWTTNTKITTPKLAVGHTYFWIVQACDGIIHQCAASVWRSFTVEPD